MVTDILIPINQAPEYVAKGYVIVVMLWASGVAIMHRKES